MTTSFVQANSIGDLQVAVNAAITGGRQPYGPPSVIGGTLAQKLVTDELGITAFTYLYAGSFGELALLIDAAIADGYSLVDGAFDYKGKPVQCVAATTVVGAGTPAAVTGMTVTEGGSAATHVTTFDFDNVLLSLADNPGVGQHGGFKLYTYPVGAIYFATWAINLTVTTESGTLTTTYEGRIYIGGEDVGPVDGVGVDSITGIIANAVANVQTRDEVGAYNYPLTDRTAEFWLSMFVTDDASHTAATCRVNGSITITWFPLSV
jgi:hypothetical protein